MGDFFSNLSPWAKGAIILLGVIVLFVIFNYEPVPDMPEVEKTMTLEPDYQYEDTTVYEDEHPVTPSVQEEEDTLAMVEDQPVATQPAQQKPQPKAKTGAPATTSAPVAEGDFYSIQVASLKEMDRAQNLASEIKKNGYDVEVVAQEIPGKGTWHRVYIGRFGTRAKAESQLPKIKATYKDSFIKLRHP